MYNVSSPAAFRLPKFTPDEAAYGSAAIRWVTAGGVHGRPTHHDVREYVQRTPSQECMCRECRAFYVGGSKRLDSWRDLCLRYDAQRMLFRGLLKLVRDTGINVTLHEDIVKALGDHPPLPAISVLDAEDRRELEEFRRQAAIMGALQEST